MLLSWSWGGSGGVNNECGQKMELAHVQETKDLTLWPLFACVLFFMAT